MPSSRRPLLSPTPIIFQKSDTACRGNNYVPSRHGPQRPVVNSVNIQPKHRVKLLYHAVSDTCLSVILSCVLSNCISVHNRMNKKSKLKSWIGPLVFKKIL